MTEKKQPQPKKQPKKQPSQEVKTSVVQKNEFQDEKESKSQVSVLTHDKLTLESGFDVRVTKTEEGAAFMLDERILKGWVKLSKSDAEKFAQILVKMTK